MAISSYLSLIAFFVFAQAITLTEAQETIDVFRWVVPYEGPQEFTANVGDTMIFRWAQGVHNVYIHPTMDCTLDGAIAVGTTPGTAYTFVEADGSPEGKDMFFSCDIGQGGHCRAGQWLIAKVFSAAGEETDVVAADPVDEEPEIAAEAPATEEPDVAVAEEAPPTDAPVEEANKSEAPVAATIPDAPEEEAAEEEAAEEDSATESEAAESSGVNHVNSLACVAVLSAAFLALIL